ncbi:hypothetical protein FGB62_22g113 [Gracilaria domingensis]|nr:hypothetical protein FGB62_22g113 [Gracilaria domingensis]
MRMPNTRHGDENKSGEEANVHAQPCAAAVKSKQHERVKSMGMLEGLVRNGENMGDPGKGTEGRRGWCSMTAVIQGESQFVLWQNVSSAIVDLGNARANKIEENEDERGSQGAQSDDPDKG